MSARTASVVLIAAISRSMDIARNANPLPSVAPARAVASSASSAASVPAREAPAAHTSAPAASEAAASQPAARRRAAPTNCRSSVGVSSMVASAPSPAIDAPRATLYAASTSGASDCVTVGACGATWRIRRADRRLPSTISTMPVSCGPASTDVVSVWRLLPCTARSNASGAASMRTTGAHASSAVTHASTRAPSAAKASSPFAVRAMAAGVSGAMVNQRSGSTVSICRRAPCATGGSCTCFTCRCAMPIATPMLRTAPAVAASRATDSLMVSGVYGTVNVWAPRRPDRTTTRSTSAPISTPATARLTGHARASARTPAGCPAPRTPPALRASAGARAASRAR